MTDYASFDENAINTALANARNHFAGLDTAEFVASPANAYLSLSGGCISLTTQNNSVCVNLPLGLGSHCIPLPISVANGTAAQACLDLCTTWGIPHGVKVTVSVAGQTVASKSFGSC